jgi:hypothetical protein
MIISPAEYQFDQLTIKDLAVAGFNFLAILKVQGALIQ